MWAAYTGTFAGPDGAGISGMHCIFIFSFILLLTFCFTLYLSFLSFISFPGT